MVTYGFFNSVDGDRRYTADQMSNYFKGLISDGVYEGLGSAMVVTAGDSMTVNVGTGRAIIDCKWINLDGVEILDISPASPTQARYTAVVVRLDLTNRTISLMTKDGEPAASPEYPEITSTDLIKELCLAMVYVPANAVSILQTNIVDKRGTDLCLWVTGLIQQLDTSTLFLQWQAAFEEFFEALTGRLQVNTYIQEYHKSATLDGSATTVTLDMTGYTYADTDIIRIHINGLLAKEGTDYSITVVSGVARLSGLPAVSGTEVDIDVLKSKIGMQVVSLGNNDALGTDSNTAIMG